MFFGKCNNNNHFKYCRGATNNDFFGTSPIEPKEKTYTWTGVGEALTMALKMEKDVTGRMKDMIDVCSTSGRDDPHAADWLTGKVVLHHIFSYSFFHINSSLSSFYSKWFSLSHEAISVSILKLANVQCSK